MNYVHTLYNVTPSPQRTGVSNNILPYFTDYNVMIYSRGHDLPLTSLFYTGRFNGYCVHADCREVLVKQAGGYPALSTQDILLHVVDKLGKNFQRNLPWGGAELPGVPHVYPFLAGYNVDYLTHIYEISNKQTETTFTPGSKDWNELAAATAADFISGSSMFPWSGFGEIIYYNPKRKAYQDELSLYAGKTPLTPIPEFITFSQENHKHPIIQIHYWIGDDAAYNDLVGWATKNPQANIILCHGGYEKGDNINDWIRKIARIPKNILVEVSWTLLDMIYENSSWIYDQLPAVRYVYGSDATPHTFTNGRDTDLVIDKLVQVSTMLDSGRFAIPLEGNTFYPQYKVPNGGDVITGEQKIRI